MLNVTVFCCICGAAHDARSPGVLYRSMDRRWWCTDDGSCLDRASALLVRQAEAARDRAMAEASPELAAMYAALDQVWADLEANDWRI